jgi:hypothetical protein
LSRIVFHCRLRQWLSWKLRLYFAHLCHLRNGSLACLKFISIAFLATSVRIGDLFL